MKRIFTLTTVLLICLVTRSLAQGPSSITGKVKDNASKPLQSVTVSLLNAKDSSLVKTDMSDANGNFEINSSKEGSFLLRYSSVGFEQQYSAAFEKKDGQKVAMKQ